MGRKKARTPGEIVAKLRQAAVLIGQEKTVAEAVRAIGVTEPTWYRWRTELGGLKLDQGKRLKEFERENAPVPPARPEGGATGPVADQLRTRPGCDGPLKIHPDHATGAGQRATAYCE